MSFAVVNSRALCGMSAPLVEVEVHLANGLPQFNIVGLPDTEVKESRDRVRAAIIQSGLIFLPKKLRLILRLLIYLKNQDDSTYLLPSVF